MSMSEVRSATVDALAKVLHQENLAVIRTIADRQPESVSQLADLLGAGKEELTRSLQELTQVGIIQLAQEGGTLRPILVARHARLNLLTNTYRLEPAPPSVGPFRDESAALAFLRDRLVASLHPKAIWLSGRASPRRCSAG